MTIVVYTPTARPGIDVAVESIRRQSVLGDIVWIVGDDLARELPDVGCEVITFCPRDLTDATYSLDASHNHALGLARELDADLFVFLMDYTWIPPDGVERFAQLAARHPRSLLTGIAHTSKDPDASLITDPDGAHTIFREPYGGKPAEIGWEDCRLDRSWRTAEHEQRIEPFRWEANWAAIPRAILHDERLSFDERYDEFHSHDNVDFALRASVLGYELWIDYDNVAIRLPRRTYWPEEQRFKAAEEAGMKFFYSQSHGHRLELGSGERPTDGYVHLDIRPDAPAVDIVADVSDLSALGFYQEIRACHLLEHISWRDTVQVLKHWREHLLPGGLIHLEVPNLSGHIARWSEDADDAQLVRFLYGEQDHEHNQHRTMFTRASLQMALLDAGFSRIQVNDIGLVLVADATVNL